MQHTRKSDPFPLNNYKSLSNCFSPWDEHYKMHGEMPSQAKQPPSSCVEWSAFVLHERPVNHQQRPYTRPPLCPLSPCGQDTIAASVVKRKDGSKGPSFPV